MGASQSISSSTTNPERKYDVFISFRGEDTRNNITSHLYEALCRKKIHTFIDYQLERGDEISPALQKAIEESRISVVIFSKDYASSKWCLRELAEIIKYKKMNRQTVIPVFYHVDPSHVRKQTGSFEDSFVKHEKVSPEEVKVWREALTEAANLSGWDSSAFRPEARLVDEIVLDVLKKLNVICPSSDSKNFIGIDSRVERVISLLCIESLDFRVVGIWGMGGIGKTTIAGVVFDQISSQFESCCFVANVREESEKHGGLVHLRNQVVSKLLEENINLGSPNIPAFVKRRLESKKVFIVLDDVNSLKQLEILAGGLDRFGPGSRIIITTRDKQVLINFGVRDNIYKVAALYSDEALQLFCKYAFKEDHPPKDLMLYVETIVNYGSGNPLALKVLGSSLFGKSKQNWESALRKLKKISNLEIHSMLRISFDGLDSEERDIFLDIACFFKGERRDYIMQILNGCYFSAQVGFSVLIDKCLITLSRSNKIQMHDLLQEMGWEIVREKSFNKPGKRSRLHNQEDISLVLKRNLGTEEVKGIFLDLSKIEKLDLHSQAFERMYNLRYLKFYNDELCYPESDGNINISKVNLSHDLNYLPNELRYLHWNGYPSKALPSNFSLENLVELDLSVSNIERLWEGNKHAPKLKRLNVSHSCHLTEIPDLSNSPYLENIALLNCRSLVDISSSLQNLNNLRYLNLLVCENLRSFSTNIHFESLKRLSLCHCTNLVEFPQVSGNVEGLELFDTAIEEIPASISSLTGLIELRIFSCTRLKHISTSICKLKSLETLDLAECSKLECFPEILETMEQLEEIRLCGTAIKELPSSIKNLNGLQRLNLRECKNLERLPNSICNLTRLEELEISDCSKLAELPENIGNLRSLKYLNADRAAVNQLPSSLTDLAELQELSCSQCKGLALPASLSSLRSLNRIYLNGCNLVEVPEDIGFLPSLEELELCANNFETLPQSIKHLPALRVLRLHDCNMLHSLPDFPKRLQHLEVVNCKQLQSLLDASGLADIIIQRWIESDLFYMDANFIFTNCRKLDVQVFGKVLEESLLTVQQMTAPPAGAEEDMIRTPVSLWFPGSEIPDWFSHRSSGSSIIVQLAPPQHNGANCKFLGFALCAIIGFEEFYDKEAVSLYSISYECRFETIYGDEIGYPGSLDIRLFHGRYQNDIFVDSDHVVLGYRDYSSLIQIWDDYTTFSLNFWPSWSPKCRVKRCGVCPIYAEPIITQPCMSVEKFDTTNQELGKTEKFPDEAETSGGGNGRSDNEEMNPRPKIIKGSKSTIFINNKVVLFHRTLLDKAGLFLVYFWIFIACLFCGLCVFGILWILVLHLSTSCEIYLSSHVQNMQSKSFKQLQKSVIIIIDLS